MPSLLLRLWLEAVWRGTKEGFCDHYRCRHASAPMVSTFLTLEGRSEGVEVLGVPGILDNPLIYMILWGDSTSGTKPAFY